MQYRKRLEAIRAAWATNGAAIPSNNLPVGFDYNMALCREESFLTLCQALWREFFMKIERGDPLEGGERVIVALVYWWSERPLTREDVEEACEKAKLPDDDGDSE